MEWSNSTSTSLQCLKFNDVQSQRIGTARASVGIFTLLLSLMALAIILCLKAYKSYANRLFLYLTLATLVQSPTFTLEVLSVNYNTSQSDQPLCTISGVYSMYICWLQNLIILWITLYLVRVVVLRLAMSNKRIEIVTGICLLLIPIPVSLIPLAGYKYGMVGVWCWIKDVQITDCKEIDTLGLVYQYVLWFVPVIIEVCIIAIATVTMATILCARGFIAKKYILFQYEYRRLIRDSLPLLAFPIVFCVLSVFELSLYIQGTRGQPDYTLWMINAIITPCKGLLMILGYILPMVYIRVKDYRNRKMIVLRSDERRIESSMDNISIRFLSSGGEEHYGSIEIIKHNK